MNIINENDICRKFNFDAFEIKYDAYTRGYSVNAARNEIYVCVFIAKNCTIGTHTSTSYNDDGTTDTHTHTVTTEQFIKTLEMACKQLQRALNYKEK